MLSASKYSSSFELFSGGDTASFSTPDVLLSSLVPDIVAGSVDSSTVWFVESSSCLLLVSSPSEMF